jgi:hypothetical protein
LSPNLFLLVADILQDLIKTDGGIRHPMADGLCPGLQYADDTIILVKAELGDITRLKNLLDMFSSATRLAINYDKSTVTPLHLKDGALDQLLEILHCKVGTFPQTYLGLPLSNLKLQLFDFAPLFAKWTGTWQAGRRYCCLLRAASFSSTHCSPEYQPMPWGR